MPEQLSQYLTPETITVWGTRIVGALVVLVIGWMIAGWFGRLATAALERNKVDTALSRFLGSIVRYTVIFAVIIAATSTLGIETMSLTAIFASAGLAVGLALQGSLSNFAAGVMVLFFRPFTIGDVITTNGKTARVSDIGLFATELMTADGTKVIVGNGAVIGGVIENHTVLGKFRRTVDIGVDYGSDLEQVRAALTRAATAVEGKVVDADYAGFDVAFVSFGGSSLDWKVHIWATPENRLAVLESLRVNIYNELNAAEIGIPFPQLDVHFDQPPAA